MGRRSQEHQQPGCGTEHHCQHPQSPPLCKKTESALLWEHWKQLSCLKDFRLHRRQQGTATEDVRRAPRTSNSDSHNDQGGENLPSTQLCGFPASNQAPVCLTSKKVPKRRV